MTRLARLTLAGMLLAAVPASAGDVKVSFSNGLVTIVATDASPRQILTEWARQGQVRVTNLDRLTGGPITVQMTDVPEAQALETLLRGTAGYVAAPRAEGVAAASSYDRILLMPGAAPALPLAGASSPPAQNNMAGRGRASNPPAYDAMADEDMENMRQALGPGRDESRADPYRQVSQGQFVMPGIAQPSAGPSAQAPVSQSSGPYGSAQISPAPFTSGSSGGRGPASIGAATPGVFTAQPQTRPMEVRQTPYSNDGPPALPAPVASSSPVPGQVVGQPPATSGAQPSAGPSGGNAPAAPFPFQNPYGLPDAIRAPVVNPNANPYGLPAPVKVTPPPATPPAPIKKSGTDGGQG